MSDNSYDSAHGRYVYGGQQIFPTEAQAAFHLQSAFPAVNVNEYLKMGALPSGFIKAGSDDGAKMGGKPKAMTKEAYELSKRDASSGMPFSQYPYLQSCNRVLAGSGSTGVPLRQRTMFSMVPSAGAPGGKSSGQGYRLVGSPYVGQVSQGGYYGYPAQFPYMQQGGGKDPKATSPAESALKWEQKSAPAAAAATQGPKAQEQPQNPSQQQQQQQVVWMKNAPGGPGASQVPSPQIPYYMPYGKMPVPNIPVKIPQWQKENVFAVPGAGRAWVGSHWQPRAWVPFACPGRGMTIIPTSHYPFMVPTSKAAASAEASETPKETKKEIVDQAVGSEEAPSKVEGDDGGRSQSPKTAAQSSSLEGQSCPGTSGTSASQGTDCTTESSGGNGQTGQGSAEQSSAGTVHSQTSAGGPAASGALIMASQPSPMGVPTLRGAAMLASQGIMTSHMSAMPRYQMIYNSALKRPFSTPAQTGEETLTQASKRPKGDAAAFVGPRLVFPTAAGGQAMIAPIPRGPTMGRRRMVVISNPWGARPAPQPTPQPAPKDPQNA